MTAERLDEVRNGVRSDSSEHRRLDSSGLQRLRKEEFPLTAGCTYLNHAVSSPLPQRSVKALYDYAGLRAQRQRAYQTGMVDYDLAPLRNGLVELLGCDA